METWATFSIIDHRQPIYRQALALFDKIVVPIPPRPIGDQTQQELDQLFAEVTFLESKGAARRYDWSSEAFSVWQAPLLAKALAMGINRDPFEDTRFMMAQTIKEEGVEAVPVFGGMEEYAATTDVLSQAWWEVEEALRWEVAQKLPVPEHDTALDDLIRLRDSAAFRQSVTDLNEWKRTEIPAIILSPDRKDAIAKAMERFDRFTKDYDSHMRAAGFHKMGTVGSIFIAAIKADPIGLLEKGATSFSELREPRWKKLSAMKCAPGGLVYHFKEAVH